MNQSTHKIYIGTLVSIVIITSLYLTYLGASYYATPLEERFYHPDHPNLKPSGIFGHGLGIVGTLLILIGVFGYMARKHFRSLSRLGILKHWLEFHIFLCTLGPIMILFHTAFKFGGIVSVSFWSMVAVVASGVIGRFIYKQIPRTIQGRELSRQEVLEMKLQIQNAIINTTSEETVLQTLKQIDLNQQEKKGLNNYFRRLFSDWKQQKKLQKNLAALTLPTEIRNKIIQLTKQDLSLQRKIENLGYMQKLFRYWHIAHLPFALIMLIIMVIHVAVTLSFGYKWIF